MAIAGRLENLARPGSQRRDRRRTLRLEAQGELASGDATEVVIHNVSETGLLIESDAGLTPGERIEIDLPHAGATAARVVWTSGRLFGCEFDTPVSTAVLGAVQLRSVVAEPVELNPPLVPHALPGESFAMRLHRLRKERGLSLSRIATQLGVSKPTVWAWEQGKARPVESRIDALAEVLGVERIELMAGTQRHGLDETLSRSREQIAGALGTSVDKVRIMIEL